MMKPTDVLLICGLLILIYHGDLSINADIVSDVLGNVDRINQQIRQNVNSQVAKAQQLAEEAVRQAAEESKNLDKYSSASNSHTIKSGTDSEGRPYYIETENVVVGNKLYHTERVYNQTTKKFDEFKKTVDIGERRKRKKRQSLKKKLTSNLIKKKQEP